ncbi:hypothetical protein ACSLVQ_29070, partial [Klebsiella pneumoniae]|uniref:hypothetical protein n=1 Tax=Klebsiella pneumoniae TaxID=573 RepID=UPI003EE3B81E
MAAPNDSPDRTQIVYQVTAIDANGVHLLSRRVNSNGTLDAAHGAARVIAKSKFPLVRAHITKSLQFKGLLQS